MNKNAHKMVFVSPHPDDAEYGAGALACHAAEVGIEVIFVILTRGEKGGDPALRTEEAVMASKVLGVKHIYLGDFPDTNLCADHNTITFIEQHMDGAYAAIIPSLAEMHQDHYNAARACLAACRGVPCVFAYESPSTTAAFSPTTYAPVDEHLLNAKRMALDCHRTQITQHKMYLDYEAILRLVDFRGRQAGLLRAEAFETIRNVFHVY